MHDLAHLIPHSPPLELIVHVDRLVRPSYPHWVKRLKHPELECTGPATYDLTNIDLWLHTQRRGTYIYSELIRAGLIASCLNLQDALAIRRKGLAVFRAVFGGKVPFFWASAVEQRGVRELPFRVPFLYESNESVVLGWGSEDDGFTSDNPALRFLD